MIEPKYKVGDKLFLTTSSHTNLPVEIMKITITHTLKKSTLHYGCRRLDNPEVFFSGITENNLSNNSWIALTNLEICKMLSIDIIPLYEHSKVIINESYFINEQEYKFENGRLYKRVDL